MYRKDESFFARPSYSTEIALKTKELQKRIQSDVKWLDRYLEQQEKEIEYLKRVTISLPHFFRKIRKEKE